MDPTADSDSSRELLAQRAFPRVLARGIVDDARAEVAVAQGAGPLAPVELAP